MKDFELLPHTADLKIRAYGATLHELFTNALKGMFNSIHPISSGCTYQNDRLVCPSLPIKHSLTVTASDLESLLVNFLSEALYLSDRYNEVYLDALFKTLDDYSLQGIIFGVPIQGFEVVEIKAVTYHDLIIKKVNDMWQADIVFDI